MNKKRIIVSILAAGTLVSAANRYVRQGASGSGNDWINAYGNLPSTLVRGDTYYVADGSYGGYAFDDANSGNLLITVKKAVQTDHGTETGWNAAYGDGRAVWTSLAINKGFLVIDGRSGMDRSGYGIECSGVTFANGVSHVTVKYADIHAYPEGSAKSAMTSYGHAVYALGCSHLTFSRCYIHHIYGCQFLWRDNRNVTVEYCFLANNKSTAAMHAEGISDDGSDSVVLRFNKWCDIDGTAFVAGIAGSGGIADHWDVYGNVFWHTEAYGAGVSAVLSIIKDASNDVTAANWRVVNNTIAAINGTAVFSFNSSATSNVQIKNNLFWQDRRNDLYERYMYFTIGGTGNVYDYNYYAACAHPYSFENAAHEPPITDGPHCRLSAIPSEPLFVSPASGDFHLARPLTGYPGIALAAPFLADLDGAVRGSDGTWDIGAYEYSAGAPAEPSATRGSLAKGGPALFSIYDIKGRRVRSFKRTYEGEIPFACFGETDRGLPSGIYLYRIATDRGTVMARRIVLK